MVYNNPPRLGNRPGNLPQTGTYQPIPNRPPVQPQNNSGPLGLSLNTITDIPGQATNVLGEAAQLTNMLGQVSTLLVSLHGTVAEVTKLANQLTQLVAQISNLVAQVNQIFNPTGKNNQHNVPQIPNGLPQEIDRLYKEAQKILGNAPAPPVQQELPPLSPQQLAQLYAQLYGQHQR